MFSCETLQNMGRPGYEAISMYSLVSEFLSVVVV